jgi:hypothetical protein
LRELLLAAVSPERIFFAEQNCRVPVVRFLLNHGAARQSGISENDSRGNANGAGSQLFRRSADLAM